MKKLLTLFAMVFLPLLASSKNDPELGINSNLPFDNNLFSFVVTLGQPFDSPMLGNPHNVGPIVWTSSNPEVATVDENGIITLVSGGHTQIKAYFAGNDEYNAGTAEYSLYVSASSDPGPTNPEPIVNPDPVPSDPVDPELSYFNNSSYSSYYVVALGQPFAPTLNNPYNVGPITWTSSNPEVATVDDNGVVTSLAAGITQIKASFAGNDLFKSGMAIYTLIVRNDDYYKADPVLSISPNFPFDDDLGYVVTPGQPFALTLNNPDNVGPIVWISSYPEVATIDENGVGTSLADGWAQFVAFFAGNDEYNSGMAEFWLHVSSSYDPSPTDPALSINYSEHHAYHWDFIVSIDKPFNSPKLINPYNVGPIVWTSSNPKVATVDENGVVKLVSTGDTEIKASFAGNDEYYSGSAEYRLFVSKGVDPELGFIYSEQYKCYVASLGQPFIPSLNNPHDVGPIEWTSFDPEVATVDENGVVTLLSVGRAQINAYYAGNYQYFPVAGNYQYFPVTPSYTLYVVDSKYEVNSDGSTDWSTLAIKGGEQTGDVIIESSYHLEFDYFQANFLVTAIAEDAFKDNLGITSVTIPDGIKEIRNNAFNGCANLHTINIGRTVNRIGNKAFAKVGTESLARTRGEDSPITVRCYADCVPMTAEAIFENTPIETGTLIVNDNIIDAYKTTAPWNKFGKIIGFNEATGIKSISVKSQNAQKDLIFDLQGNRLNNFRKGLNIVRMKDGKTKKIFVR